MTYQRVKRLDGSWKLQPKHDGVYSIVLLDDEGMVKNVYSRNMIEYHESLHRMADAGVVGSPRCVLVGELTAYTERGREEANRLGYTRIHLFDMLRDGDRDVSREPYQKRRDLLGRMHAILQEDSDGRTWDDDANGAHHNRASGRFCRPVPQGWRRVPLVEQRPLGDFDDLWGGVCRGVYEGLVAVNSRAPVGRNGSKLKLKPRHYIDAVVVDAQERRAAVRTAEGIEFTVACSGWHLQPDTWVEIAYEGLYSTGTPKHPRVVRMRYDLL